MTIVILGFVKIQITPCIWLVKLSLPQEVTVYSTNSPFQILAFLNVIGNFKQFFEKYTERCPSTPCRRKFGISAISNILIEFTESHSERGATQIRGQDGSLV